MVRRQLVLFLLVSLCVSAYAQSPAWSGIINSDRAVDWANAGVVGGIPSGTWTQCGSTIAAGASASSINTQLAGCSVNQYVLLGPGIFNLGTGLVIQSNEALRGSGANSTLLVFTGDTSCNGYGADVCIAGSNNSPGGEQNVCDWTAGYSVGTTLITLANCGRTTPAAGSLSNLSVGSILYLDQTDESADTGWVWNCLVTNVCSNGGSGGAARTDGTCGSTCNRSQQQAVVVTNISGSNITISPGLYMPNWNSASQKPQAWFPNTTVSNAGVENLSMNHASSTSASWGVALMNCVACWVSGVRSLTPNRGHVGLTGCAHCTIQNSYFYQNQSHASRAYGIELFWGASDDLIQNNICQQITDGCPNNTGGAEGVIAAYNFAVDDIYTSPGWMQPTFYQHASGDAFWLWEGNIGSGYIADNVHGNHHFNTLFRNRLTGWEPSCGGSPCTAQTVPVQTYGASRFMNVVGNVLGQTSYQNTYACTATNNSTCSNGNTAIYTVGYTGNGGGVNNSVTGFVSDCGGSGALDYEKCTTTGLLRWGNYDVVTAANQFNSSEVPSGLTHYSNSVPSSHTLPASFYLSAKPSWWKSEPWPPIGPDVTGGNLGRCSGGTYAGSLATNSSQCTGGSLASAVSGEANSNPALDCYLNTMGGPPDGSGSALSFNPTDCYAPLAPPAQLTTGVH